MMRSSKGGRPEPELAGNRGDQERTTDPAMNRHTERMKQVPIQEDSSRNGESQQVETIDESGDKKYFTQIPNIVLDIGLSPHAKTLYIHLKRTCGEGGKNWKAVKQLAEECGMSAGKVSEATAELKEAKLIEVAQPSRRSRSCITITDVWLRNIQHFSKDPSVHNMNTERSQYERYRKNPLEEEQTSSYEDGVTTQPDVMKNPFGYYCAVANALGVPVLPDDRKETAKNFKDLIRLEKPTEEELKWVVSKMLNGRTTGKFWSPQKTLGFFRGDNVQKLREDDAWANSTEL